MRKIIIQFTLLVATIYYGGQYLSRVMDGKVLVLTCGTIAQSRPQHAI